MLLTVLALTLLCFLFRSYHYARRASFLIGFHKLFFDYLDSYHKNKNIKFNKRSPPPFKILYEEILSKQEMVKRYVSEAGIENPVVANATPVGYGFIDTNSISVLDNIAYLDDVRIFDSVNQTIQRAIGYYRHQMNESLNPLLWPEYIVLKMPKSLITKTIEIIKCALAK